VKVRHVDNAILVSVCLWIAGKCGEVLVANVKVRHVDNAILVSVCLWIAGKCGEVLVAINECRFAGRDVESANDKNNRIIGEDGGDTNYDGKERV